MTEKQLLDLKDSIEKKKLELSKLEGRREHLLEQLMNDWQCKTVDEAKKTLQRLKQQRQQLEVKIQEALDKLEETYEFDS